ncbi:hypothetical protein PCASD_01211 [Puccinia coronata f. sp. avenae]|uniref:Uncharacterized protein n=1 Tax=Puccinia coronata f. sp. avenae TaxID=200324 RepID=A0A2N5T7H1_9BASI|nr:hypothetical protein PCASD_17281 [Puccinia coronata f. sp. avenae]PLW50964.1 hypothetical protein PCASD_01211 [Puccinia coronata f. sp. avenae]
MAGGGFGLLDPISAYNGWRTLNLSRAAVMSYIVASTGSGQFVSVEYHPTRAVCQRRVNADPAILSFVRMSTGIFPHDIAIQVRDNLRSEPTLSSLQRAISRIMYGASHDSRGNRSLEERNKVAPENYLKARPEPPTSPSLTRHFPHHPPH